MKLKNLPLGDSSFENIIKENKIYVDKTRLLYTLITEAKFYFLSRPRRFGKSLLVSTLKNIFFGNRELFKNLWIDSSDYTWEKHPVILIDFNEIISETPDKLKNGLCRTLDKIASEYGIELKDKEFKYKFESLITSLADKTGSSVVVLIDEYDKPIITHLGLGKERLEIAKQNREILKSLFGTLKGKSVISNLRFVLLTGVSKFSKAGVFSELNNLSDITMDSAYSDILGIREDEIDANFKDYIEVLATEFGVDYQKMKMMIKENYNGYRFSRKNCYVYNPFSLLNFLKKREIKNYWFESGTPTFLVELIKERDFYIPNGENLIVDESIFSSYELDDLAPESLLFQTGYLTIKNYDFEKSRYTLSYPNKEVKYSFLKILYNSLFENQDRENKFLRLGKYLRDGDIEAFIETAKAIFAGIAYSVGSKLNEANFHTIFYLMVNAGGLPADMELLTSDGRIDMVAKIKGKIYIIEFKCNQSAEKALDQIKNKYLLRFKSETPNQQLFLLGINFDSQTRNISEWKWATG